MKVIVIGAGVAGLAAADRLLENGCPDVSIYERAPFTGGLARSVKHDGYTFDLGPHQFHTDDESLILFIRELLGDDLLTCKKRSSQYYFGRYLNYPLGMNDVVRGLPLKISLTCFLDFCFETMVGPFRKVPDPDTFESWVTRRFGRRMYQIYFEPYTRKVWGRDPAKLSSFCAEERIAVQSLFHVILSMIRGGRTRFSKSRYFTHTPYTEQFFYPKQGTGMIAEALADRITARGGSIYTGCGIESIRPREGGFEVVTTSGESAMCDKLIATVPLTILRDLLDVDDKPDDSLSYRSLVFLFLASEHAPSVDYHWTYFPDADCPFQRVTDFSRFSDQMAPAGAHAICLEFPCDPGDETWNASGEELLARAGPHLVASGYIDVAQVTATWTLRERCAYPVYDLYYEQALENLNRFIEEIDGIYTVGRQARFSYVDVNDVIPASRELADRVCARD